MTNPTENKRSSTPAEDTPQASGIPSTHAGNTGFGSGQISPRSGAGESATSSASAAADSSRQGGSSGSASPSSDQKS